MYKFRLYTTLSDAGCSQTDFHMQTLKIKSLDDAMELLSIIVENAHSSRQKKDKLVH